MTFFIRVADDRTYTRIMDSIISRSLTHCKEMDGGIVQLEIKGSPEDYKFFESEVFIMNGQRGQQVSSITEAL